MDPTASFYSNWLNNRKNILRSNIGDDATILDAEKEISYLLNNMNNAKVYNDLDYNAYYDPNTNLIHTSDLKLVPHEKIHAANDYKLRFSPQIHKISTIIDNKLDNYYRSPNEIYPRLMHIRLLYNLNPNKVLNIQDINLLRLKVNTPEATELFNNINNDEAIKLFNDVAYNKSNKTYI